MESYICDICGRSFAYKYRYKQHLQNKKPCDKKYKCDICNKNFKNNYYLNRHLNNKNGCKKNEDINLIELEKLKLQVKLKELEIEERKLINLGNINNGTINNIHNGDNNNYNIVNVIPFTKESINLNELTIDDIAGGPKSMKNFILKQMNKNYICTDLAREMCYRLEEKQTWTKDPKGKYILDEILPIIQEKIEDLYVLYNYKNPLSYDPNHETSNMVHQYCKFSGNMNQFHKEMMPDLCKDVYMERNEFKKLKNQ